MSKDETAPPKRQEEPGLLIWLGVYAIFGCAIFTLSIMIADFVVPDHDWIADTISDLGAGKYEFIVDVGIYAFSASLIALALLAAHAHMGGLGWSVGIVGLAFLGLIVFLVGARNEYCDNDSEGVVIHIYLVYALGLLFTVVPWLMSGGAGRAGSAYGRMLKTTTIVWALSAPVFFFLPKGVDGIYERYLGLITFVIVTTLAVFFIRRGRKLQVG
ncbi:MAG: DUF998 domain-containing protein [Pseudomonadota bacterium]